MPTKQEKFVDEKRSTSLSNLAASTMTSKINRFRTKRYIYCIIIKPTAREKKKRKQINEEKKKCKRYEIETKKCSKKGSGTL